MQRNKKLMSKSKSPHIIGGQQKYCQIDILICTVISLACYRILSFLILNLITNLTTKQRTQEAARAPSFSQLYLLL